MTRGPFALAVAPAALAFALTFALACKPKLGGQCTATAGASGTVCVDKATALFCADGVYTQVSCRGEKACSAGECDESIAAEQDPCSIPDAIACSVDHKEALRCVNRRFVLDETCKGPTGCKVASPAKISCDNNVADVNDPCQLEGDYACTTDRSLALRCERHTMRPLNTCRGPKQCVILPRPNTDRVDFSCDDSIAEEGDACDTNGEEACTMDRKGMFVCRGNKFGSLKPCAGGCLYEEKTDRYTCNETVPTPSPDAAPPPVAPKHRGRH
jgi:hypothetical protein